MSFIENVDTLFENEQSKELVRLKNELQNLKIAMNKIVNAKIMDGSLIVLYTR